MLPCVGIKDRFSVVIQQIVGVGSWLGYLSSATFRLRNLLRETILIIRDVNARGYGDLLQVVDAGDALRLGFGFSKGRE